MGEELLQSPCALETLKLHLSLTQDAYHRGPFKTQDLQSSPVVQGLRLCADTAGDTGSIPGQGTKIPHALQWVERNQKGKEGTQFFPDTSTLLRPTTKPTRLLSYFLNSVLSGTKTLTDLRWWRKKSQRSAVFLFQVTFAASQKLPRFSMP